MEKEKKEHPFKDYVSEETVNHLKAAHSEFHKSIAGLVPPEFLAHRKAARKEMILAMRSFLDDALNRMETSEAE